jgi:tetratricopeptide (TPR) repeat protein
MPEFPHIWEYKGHSHLNIGEYDRAKEAFIQALHYKAHSTSNWCFLALSIYMKGDIGDKETAYYVLESAHDMADNVATLALARGIMEEYDGQSTDALISYMQSQILASGDDKHFAAQRAYRLLQQ